MCLGSSFNCLNIVVNLPFLYIWSQVNDQIVHVFQLFKIAIFASPVLNLALNCVCWKKPPVCMCYKSHYFEWIMTQQKCLQEITSLCYAAHSTEDSHKISFLEWWFLHYFLFQTMLWNRRLLFPIPVKANFASTPDLHNKVQGTHYMYASKNNWQSEGSTIF